MSFWKPYFAMRQLWRGSLDPENGKGRIDPPNLAIAWWVAWLAGGTLYSIASAMMDALARSGDWPFYFNTYVPALWMSIAATIVTLLSVICLLPIVRQIAKAQDAMLLAPAA